MFFFPAKNRVAQATALLIAMSCLSTSATAHDGSGSRASLLCASVVSSALPLIDGNMPTARVDSASPVWL